MPQAAVLKKESSTTVEVSNTTSQRAEVFELSEERRRTIAQIAEEACSLEGNICGPDLDLGGSLAASRIVSDFA